MQHVQAFRIKLRPQRYPLNKTLRKNEQKQIGPVNEKDSIPVAYLKKVLISPPVPALLKSKGQYTINSYPCDKHTSCVLHQEQKDGSYRPVGNWSLTLNNEKQKLVTSHKEFLADVKAVTSVRPYMGGGRLTIQEYHQAL